MSLPQSKILVDSIEPYDTSRVTVSYGATIPSGQTINGAGDINISGIVTATQFNGNGSGITGLSVATVGHSIALTIIS
tara:strand:- start:417 stop:650 length:234 start_codon:yes stop_codon:yes gene_type:complete